MLISDIGLRTPDFGLFLVMKKPALRIVIALLLAVLSGVMPMRAMGGLAPDLTVEQSTFDFGNVFAGEEIEHTFLIRNNGAKPVELRQRIEVGATPATDGDRDLRGRIVRAGFASNFSTATLARRAAPS
jgi:hypothetical protein